MNKTVICNTTALIVGGGALCFGGYLIGIRKSRKIYNDKNDKETILLQKMTDEWKARMTCKKENTDFTQRLLFFHFLEANYLPLLLFIVFNEKCKIVIF